MLALAFGEGCTHRHTHTHRHTDISLATTTTTTTNGNTSNSITNTINSTISIGSIYLLILLHRTAAKGSNIHHFFISEQFGSNGSCDAINKAVITRHQTLVMSPIELQMKGTTTPTTQKHCPPIRHHHHHHHQ